MNGDSAAKGRRFWMTMDYQCDRCGRRILFYLEDGCEGPRDGGEDLHVVTDGPYRGQLRPWPKTSSGRLVLPVPFIAAGCPTCQPGPPWSMARGAGVLSHVDWRSDRQFPAAMLTDVPADAGLFLYPSDPHANQACGEPVLPGKRAAVSRLLR